MNKKQATIGIIIVVILIVGFMVSVKLISKEIINDEVSNNVISNPPLGAQTFTENKRSRLLNQPQSPTEYFQILAATTTYQGPPKRHTIYFEGPYQEQGTCVALKDRSGVGATYITTEDGVLSVSTLSCE